METTYGYDDAGRQTAVTVAGATTTTAYDALSRVVKLTSPSGATTTYSYDAGGRQTKVTTPRERLGRSMTVPTEWYRRLMLWAQRLTTSTTLVVSWRQ